MFLIITSMMSSCAGGPSPVGTSTVLTLLSYDSEGLVPDIMAVCVRGTAGIRPRICTSYTM